jgi:hypothetical protein
VLPEGAPATALKLTGEVTVEFADGEQNVTAPAVAEQDEPVVTETEAAADFVGSAWLVTVTVWFPEDDGAV